MQLKCIEKFKPCIQKRKRLKILVGGRGSTKTSFASTRVATGMTFGEVWACGREYMSTIKQSVHTELSNEIKSLDLQGFNILEKEIQHSSGGQAFYVGFARNIDNIKGQLSGKNLWIEEGDTLSEESIIKIFRTVRLDRHSIERQVEALMKHHRCSQSEAEKLLVHPEIWVTMNRGSREDAISKHYLSRAEASLARRGYYEDEECLIVQANYTDVPKQWFLNSGLEEQRAADERNLSTKMYNHVWHGHYIEAVENAIIKEEWFDSCVDAHEKLGFKAQGFEVVSHDPSDEGEDAKGTAHRIGSVFVNVEEDKNGDVNQGIDKALAYTASVKPDAFTWDESGLGLGLKLQVRMALGGKKIDYEGFNGSNTPKNPDQVYNSAFHANQGKEKTNTELFLNQRSQFYRYLADRMLRTHIALQTGTRYDEEELISFSSKIPADTLNKLRAELCRIPILPDKNKEQIMRKDQMKSKYGIPSPNLADSVMMNLSVSPKMAADDWGDDNYEDFERSDLA